LQDREVSGNWLEELPLNFVNRFRRLVRVGHESPVGRCLPAAFLENARFGDSWHGLPLVKRAQAQPSRLRLDSSAYDAASAACSCSKAA
jgi:hypothetical protein